uniref:Uncharacterized protein n=1 Tax=Timema monikensis TaxID=170555 RepID=A0A7R9HNP5_9NEOP|nr:unnamed protein product [Timema monikensis]
MACRSFLRRYDCTVTSTLTKRHRSRIVHSHYLRHRHANQAPGGHIGRHLRIFHADNLFTGFQQQFIFVSWCSRDLGREEFFVTLTRYRKCEDPGNTAARLALAMLASGPPSPEAISTV